MKLYNLTLREWAEYAQRYVDQFGKQSVLLRCETVLSVGWRMGGFTYNGNTFNAFNPKDESGQNVMLAVRSDFERWVKKELIELERIRRVGKKTFEQMEML